MKPMRIAILIIFVFVSIASLTVYIGEKISTDKTFPEIKVEEEMIEVGLKVTDEELLKGVTAYDKKDKDLTDKIIVESISKFTEKGVSKVTYAVCDSNNNIAKATRKIRYKGYESPKFKVKDNLCFSLYETIDLRGIITATDSLEGNISGELVITSDDYTGATAGAFTINLTVTNQKGDTSTATLPLIVEDRPLSAPEIILSDYLIYAKIGETIDFAGLIVEALDYNGESINTNKISVESTVDFSKAGTYHVHYYTTDSNDLRGHSVLTVIVGE